MFTAASGRDRSSRAREFFLVEGEGRENFRVLTQVRLSCVTHTNEFWYGVALVSRIDQIIGLFRLLKRRYSAKETYNLIDPTDRSHPIRV